MEHRRRGNQDAERARTVGTGSGSGFRSASGPYRCWLLVAAVIGIVNAAPSLYWGLGGDLLLPTIGQWLIELRADAPVIMGVSLLGLALGKSVVALLPMLLTRKTQPVKTQRWVGRISVILSVLLLLYGSIGVLTNAGALLGLWGIGPAGDVQWIPGTGSVADSTARWGQLLLWYPMLILWGLALAYALLLRYRRARTHRCTT